MTPRGRVVEPEVYCRNARLSRCKTGFCQSGARAVAIPSVLSQRKACRSGASGNLAWAVSMTAVEVKANRAPESATMVAAEPLVDGDGEKRRVRQSPRRTGSRKRGSGLIQHELAHYQVSRAISRNCAARDSLALFFCAGGNGINALSIGRNPPPARTSRRFTDEMRFYRGFSSVLISRPKAIAKNRCSGRRIRPGVGGH